MVPIFSPLSGIMVPKNLKLVMIEVMQIQYKYGKCSKILNTFIFLFSNKMLVISAGIHKMLVRIANREDTDLGLLCLSSN